MTRPPPGGSGDGAGVDPPGEKGGVVPLVGSSSSSAEARGGGPVLELLEVGDVVEVCVPGLAEWETPRRGLVFYINGGSIDVELEPGWVEPFAVEWVRKIGR